MVSVIWFRHWPVSFLLVLINLVKGYNIIIYSAPIGYSHVQLTTSIADHLADAGHNVTVLAPILEEKLLNHHSKKAHIHAIRMPQEIIDMQSKRSNRFWEVGPLLDNVLSVGEVAKIQIKVCEYMLQNLEQLDILNNTVFDVGFVETNGLCGFGFFQMLKVKNYLALSAIGFHDGYSTGFDTPIMSSYVPGILLYFNEKMTFLQRMINFVWSSAAYFVFPATVSARFESLFDKYGHKLDVANDIIPNINYLLVNTDEFLDTARPVSQRIRYIGGIAVHKPGEMPEKFAKILNNSNKGIVAISFGSYAPSSLMPGAMKEAILLAVDELSDYDFIWRVDAGDLHLGQKRKNLHVATWLPQRELLNHHKLRVFVSHGGMNTVLETALAGKPAIIIPIFGDQFQNAVVFGRKNTSLALFKTDLHGANFRDRLRLLLEDHSYTQRAERLSDLMKSKRNNAVQRLLEAVEYTAKFGKIHDLDVHGFNLNFFQYFQLDVIFAFTLIVYVLFKCFHLMLRYFLRSKEKIE